MTDEPRPLAQAGVALQGTYRGVGGASEQQRQVGAVVGGVSERRVTQLRMSPVWSAKRVAPPVGGGAFVQRAWRAAVVLVFAR